MDTTLDENGSASEEGAPERQSIDSVGIRDIHRIGGSSVENLRLKPKERSLKTPGNSVLKSATAQEAADQIRSAFPRAADLHEAAKTIGSTTEEMIRHAGFEIIHVPSKLLPNHYRIVHTSGVAGFEDKILVLLAQIFVDTTGH